MNRSLKKKIFTNADFDSLFDEHVAKYSKTPTKHPLYIDFRSSYVLPKHVNYLFKVHNGKWYIPTYVTADMVGHKFGEFAKTRKSNQSKHQKTVQKKTAQKKTKK